MSLNNLSAVIAAYDLWWERRNREPLFYIVYPTGKVDWGRFAKPWMSPYIRGPWSNWQQELVFGQGLELTWKSGDWTYVEEALDFLEYYAGVTGHAAQGYSFLLPGFGPGVLSAFITDYTRFHESSIWFELEHPWEWERILAIDPAATVSYKKVAMEGLRRLVQRLQPLYVLAVPDVGAVLDVLAAVRGASNLLMDCLVCPENVAAAVAKLEQMMFSLHAEFSAIIEPGNHGCYAETMRYLCGKPTHIGICDFSAMIGPELFTQFGLSTLRRECDAFGGRVVYHMDGPGQMPHLPALLAIPNLHAIQWVPGAGNPDTLDQKWYELYRRILDGGKRICLGGAAPDVDGLRKLFKAFPKQEFFVPFTLESEKQAGELLKAL